MSQDNLFTINLENEIVRKANNLRVHSKFAEKLIADLEAQFNVYVDSKRRTQDEIKYCVYSLNQKGRYGWSSDFTVTSDGIEFRDTRGTDTGAVFEKFGMTLEQAIKLCEGDTHTVGSMHFYNADVNHKKLWERGRDLAESHGFTIKAGDCYSSSSCSGLRLSTLIRENDARLNNKIQIIIWCLLRHGITTQI